MVFCFMLRASLEYRRIQSLDCTKAHGWLQHASSPWRAAIHATLEGMANM